MKIAVCLKEVVDTRLDLGLGRVSESLIQKGLTYRLNPDDADALAVALSIRNGENSVDIIAISIGPERVEKYLRESLAIGATKAVRIWDEGFIDLSSYQRAKVLAGAISILNADLVLTGAKSLDIASGLVGPYLAAWLNLPCICEAVAFHSEGAKKCITVTRNINRGIREKVLTTLPAVITIAGQSRPLPYASLDKLLESKETPVELLTLEDLGITPLELSRDHNRVTRLSAPKPRPRKVPYDSSLPAFDRILALLKGGITKRRGEILQGSKEELVNQLFELLMKEGLIKPSVK
jgi:electron transfer flavoprotein beta subunit